MNLEEAEIVIFPRRKTSVIQFEQVKCNIIQVKKSLPKITLYNFKIPIKHGEFIITEKYPENIENLLNGTAVFIVKKKDCRIELVENVKIDYKMKIIYINFYENGERGKANED